MSKELSTEEKEKELGGKRYKIISMSINIQAESVPYEMEIDLHHSWMKTIEELKSTNKNRADKNNSKETK